MAIRAVLSSADLTPQVLGPILGADVGSVELIRHGATLAGGFALVRIDGAPRFVKWTRSECRSPAKADRNRRECRVLNDASVSGDLPAPHCHAAIALDDGSSTIVLDDLSKDWAPWTAETPRWLERGVDALAALHVAFFDERRRAVHDGSTSSADEVRDRLRGRVADMIGGDAGPREQLAAVSRIVEAGDWEGSLDRVAARDRVTLLHGDAHTGNFLFGRDGDRAMLIDWELVEIGIATDDLALFLGFHGPTDLTPSLDRYRSAVGVADDAFAEDWRSSVLRLPLIVTAYWHNGMRGDRFRHALDRSLARVGALE